jgi:calmodulin
MYVFQYDTDGSGQIEFPEFCNMMSHKMNDNDDEEMVRLAFRTLDKDGSGSIATSEFKHLMTHIGKFTRSIITDHSFY